MQSLRMSIPVVEELIRQALAEDVGAGDITTGAALRGDERGVARAVAKSGLVVAGSDVFGEVFRIWDASISFSSIRRDGEKAMPGEVVAEISGNLPSILTAERVALNLFQRMCGIATLTGRYVEAVEGRKARILDTRKTAPGLRILDKYAVRVGGGYNHRFALYDGVLIKDNHIEAAGGIGEAVRRVRDRAPLLTRIEVEVKTLTEVRQALAAGAEVIMLDNMPVETMKKAVALIGGQVLVEASGNVTLATVKGIAATGVDLISSGALTHSARASDISLKVKRKA